MITATISKVQYCKLCDSPLSGRADKKFCDDYCRGAYNNQLRGAANNHIRNINHALGKNRRILESILERNESGIRVSKGRLLQQGYNFKYSTHQFTTPSGNGYTYCYEYGYLLLEDDVYLIVKAK